MAAGDLPAALDAACLGGSQLVCAHDRSEGSALGAYRYVIEPSRETGFAHEEITRITNEVGFEYHGRNACVEG